MWCTVLCFFCRTTPAGFRISGNSANDFRWRRNCDGRRSPSSSLRMSSRTLSPSERDNLRTSSAFNAWYALSLGGLIIMSSTSAASRVSS